MESFAHANRYTAQASRYGIHEVANECRIGARRYAFIATTKAPTPSDAPTMRANLCESFIGSLADPISSTAFRCIESSVRRLEQFHRPHPGRHRPNSAADGDQDARAVEDEIVPLTAATKIITAPFGVLGRGFREDETQLLSTVARQA